MTGVPRGLRIPETLEREIAREAEQRGKTWSAAATEILEEGVRMRRVPGIVFTDGAVGRRATVAGSGIDVWELIGTWRSVDHDYARLSQAYDWLSRHQLEAALSYYELYPEEIDERLESEESWTQERIHAELPFTHPRALH